jgi:leader peptidase (prepilin peptidase)/N-methyltransferase
MSVTTSSDVTVDPADQAGEVPEAAVAVEGAPAEERVRREVPPIPRHPALAGAVVFLVIVSFGIFGFEPKAFIAAFAVSALAVLAAIDIEHRLLPNRMIFPALGVVLVAQIAVEPDRALEWILAGPAAAVFLALPLIIRRDAMGWGDVKLALLLGAIVGWQVFGAILVGCFAMVPFAIAMLVRDRSIKGATLPFGPFLAFGTVLILFAS